MNDTKEVKNTSDIVDEYFGAPLDTEEDKQRDIGGSTYYAEGSSPMVSSEVSSAREAIGNRARRENSFIDAVLTSATTKEGNFIGSVYRDIKMEYDALNNEYVPDVEFNAEEVSHSQADIYDNADRMFLSRAVNRDDYENRQRIIEDRAYKEAYIGQLNPVYGLATGIAASLIDADILIPQLKVSKTLNRAKKLQGAIKYGKANGAASRFNTDLLKLRAKAVAEPAAEAALANITTEYLRSLTGKDVSSEDIIEAGMTGLAMGGAISVTRTGMTYFDKTKYDFNQELVNNLLDYNGKMSWGEKMSELDKIESEIVTLDNIVKNRLYREVVPATDALPAKVERVNVEETIKELGGSTEDLIQPLSDVPERIKDIIDASHIDKVYTTQQAKKRYSKLDENDKRMQIAKGIDTIVEKGIAKSLYTAASEVNDVVAMFTRQTVADSSKFYVNPNNAISITMQHKNMASSRVNAAEKIYAKAMGQQGLGVFKRLKDPNRAKFAEQVYLEHNARELSGGAYRGEGVVADYMDELDKASEYLLDEAQDVRNGGANAVEGMQEITKGSYLPRVFARERFLEKRALVGDAQFSADISRSIRAGFGAKEIIISDKDAGSMAKAIINNVDKVDVKKGFNTIETRNDLYNMLKEGGMPVEDINRLIDKIFKRSEEAAKPKYAKARIPMDYSVKFSDGTTVASLLDTNIPKIYNRYSQNISGRIGLANVGFRSDAAIEDMIKASDVMDDAINVKTGRILQEGRRGSDFIRNIRDSLLGIPLEGADRGAAVDRVLSVSRLMTLNQTGFGQIIEEANIVGEFGLQALAPDTWKALKTIDGKPNALIEDFETVTSPAFHNDMTLAGLDAEAIDLDNIPKNSAFSRQFDRMLQLGLRAQQVWSLQQPVITAQRKMITALTSKRVYDLYKEFKAGNTSSWDKLKDRMSDWGFTEELKNKVFAEMNKVTKAGNKLESSTGNLECLHVSKWDREVAGEFTRAVGIQRDMLIQTQRLGEITLGASTSLGKIITDLRKYPLVALRNMLVRNVRHSDAVSFVTFMTSMTLAPLVYATKVYLNKSDEYERKIALQNGRIIRNAFAYNSITSPLSELADIFGSIFDVEALQPDWDLGKGTRGLLSERIPSLGSLETLLGAVHAGAKSIQGKELSRQDWNNIQAASIVGRIAGFSMMADYGASSFGKKRSSSAESLAKIEGNGREKTPEQKAETKKKSAERRIERYKLLGKQPLQKDIEVASKELQELIK